MVALVRIGRAILILSACLAPFSATHAFAVERVALVIGNGNYRSVPALNNPTRDAAAISESLKRLNFSVTTLLDGNASQTRKALIEFGRAAQGSEMAVVFYAGHGIEVGGENWLIPIDAELLNDTDTESEAVSLKAATLQVSKARQLGLVILDACRNNPFAATMQRSIRTRAVARGLAATEPTGNVLVAYAAKDGTTASDGDGRNSPFTTALLRNLEVPGLEITFLFRNVRDEVMDVTDRTQQPFVYGSLSKEAVYFKQPPPGSEGKPTLQLSHDEVFWTAIKDSAVPALYEEFLRRFPSSSRVEAAQRALDRTKVAALAPPPTPSAQGRINPLFTDDDAKSVANIAARYKLAMPDFEIRNVDPKTPEEFRNLLGVWVSKVGYGGQGRQAMVIVESVDPSGSVRGFYIYGPPTPSSFAQWPSAYSPFSAKIQNGEFEFMRGTSVHTITHLRSKNLLRIVDKHADGKTAMIQLEPVWLLAKHAEAQSK